MKSDGIPYEDFGGRGTLLHFSHANGYPPGAYHPLFEYLAPFCRVVAMHMRPLWPDSDPRQISDWLPLAGDLGEFVDTYGEKTQIGAGHSLGATTTLHLALQRPDLFAALILIDPVIVAPARVRLWNLICALGLEYRVLPLSKAALRRRASFEDREAMFAYFRQKQVFARLDDRSLRAYVEAGSCPNPDGSFRLCYPPEWEARIYVTGLRADLALWRGFPRLQTPLLIVRGALSDTFDEKISRRIRRRLPSVEVRTIPDTTHLAPLERPAQVAAAVSGFLSHLGHLPVSSGAPRPERRGGAFTH